MHDMKIYIEKEKRYVEFNKDCNGRELLHELNINPETVLIVKNDEIVLDGEELKNDDNIKILSVVSGG